MRPTITSLRNNYIFTLYCIERIGHELWLFGNTPDKESIGVCVNGFMPQIYVHTMPLQTTQEVLSTLNDMFNNYVDGIKTQQGYFRRTTTTPMFSDGRIVQRAPLIGYNNGVLYEVYQIACERLYDYHRLHSFFQSEQVRRRKYIAYHVDIDLQTHFINQQNISMHSPVQIKYCDQYTGTRCIAQHVVKTQAINIIPCTVNIPYTLLCCVIETVKYIGTESKNLLPTVPAVDTPTVPAVDTPAVPAVDTPTVPAVDTPAVPAVDTPTLLFGYIRLYWLEDGQNYQDFHYNGPTSMFEAWLRNIIDREYVDIILTQSPSTMTTLYECCVHLSRVYPRETKYRRKKVHDGRLVCSVSDALKKLQISPKLSSYTVIEAIFHPTLTRDQPPSELQHFDWNTLSTSSPELILHYIRQLTFWMVQLESDSSIILTFVAKSRATCSSFAEALTRGETICVYKKVCRECHLTNRIINRQQLLRSPSVLLHEECTVTYPEIHVPTSTRTHPRNVHTPAIVGRRQSAHWSFMSNTGVGKTVRTNKQTQCTGGFVFTPIRSIHSEPIALMDFASLYPSIIQGYGICYSALVYDEKYITDSRYTKQYIPITDTECIALVTHKDGEPIDTMLPQMMCTVRAERSRHKALMKLAQNDFDRKQENAKQLGCKIFQNAVYGFLGARLDHYLPCPVLMASVCTIGRWMNKTAAATVVNTYGGRIVYGDTDSIMVSLPECTTSRDMQLLSSRAINIALRISTLFPAPNELELESIYCPFWIHKKKNYAALTYNPLRLYDVPKITLKGLPFTKMNYCPWVRDVGRKMMVALLQSRPREALSLIREALDSIARNVDEYSEYAICCILKQQREYKGNAQLIQVNTARKIAAREGKDNMNSASKLLYVVLQGTGSFYTRGECYRFAQHHRLRLDKPYYIEKQLLSAITPILSLTPKLLAEVRCHIQRTLRIISRQECKQKSNFYAHFLHPAPKRLKQQHTL